ncbi:MAG: UPF0104 family protein [Frankiales bacterium]|nr:UPF0104 family protein [Frankiales bacterium]
MRRAVRLVAGALSLAAAGWLLVVVLPRTAGVGWDDTADRVAGLQAWQIISLIAVWAAGLWMHTYVLRSALPGLSRRRAFALNLGGSSVSNVLPFGGAAGIGLNYAMLRSWGYSRVQITAFTTISNLVVVLVKVAIAALGIFALVSMPPLAINLAHPGKKTALAMGVAVGIIVVATVVVVRWWRGSLRAQLVAALKLVREQCAQVLRQGWAAFLIGGIGYPVLQMALLWFCLAALGVEVSPTAVLAVFAVERLLTLVPFTPGGVGLVETAATAVLAGFGADPAAAASGVILFRVFSYLIEIPLGAIVAVAWFARGRTPALAQ